MPAPTALAALGGLRAEFQYVFPGPSLAQVASHAGFTRASGQALLRALFMTTLPLARPVMASAPPLPKVGLTRSLWPSPLAIDHRIKSVNQAEIRAVCRKGRVRRGCTGGEAGISATNCDGARHSRVHIWCTSSGGAARLGRYVSRCLGPFSEVVSTKANILVRKWCVIMRGKWPIMNVFAGLKCAHYPGSNAYGSRKGRG